MVLRWFPALLAVFTLAAKPAAADPVLNKEGFWSVGAGEVACYATINVEGGSQVMLIGQDGEVTFAVLSKKMKRGKAGKLQTDTVSFDFTPTYTGKDMMLLDGALTDRALEELHKAKEVAVIVDDRVLTGVRVEGTGFAGAIGAVSACSKGETGWWGPGMVKEPQPAANKEKIWFLERSEMAEVCTAYASADERTLVVLLGAAGEIGVAVKSSDDLRRGRKGLMEADSVAIPFKPIFDGAKYFSSDESLDASALAAVRNAKSLRLSIEGRTIVDASVEGTGLPTLLDDLAACSKGEKGWWGEGARPKPAQAPAPPGSSSSP